MTTLNFFIFKLYANYVSRWLSWQTVTDVSEEITASIIRAMNDLHAATSQKTDIFVTRRENLKPHVTV